LRSGATPPGRARNLTRLAIILGTAAALVGAAIGYGSYTVSRRFTLHDISEDNLHLAALLAQAVELHQPAIAEHAVDEVERIWHETARGFRRRYLWVIGADGRLLLVVGGPEPVGRNVGSMRIGRDATAGTTTIRQLLAAKRTWAGETRTPSGAGQVAAFVYSKALDGLIAVNVPEDQVYAELRQASLPWLAGFACTICTLLLALKLLHRAYASSQAVTGRTLAELGESESRFRQIMSQAADVLLLFDRDGRILDANQRAVEVFGSSRDELLQMTIPEKVLGPDPARNAAVRTQIDQRGVATIERLLSRRDGSTFPAEIRLARVVIHGEQQYMAAARDITDRKRTEEHKAVLLDVARAVAGTLDLAEVLSRVQQRTAQALACDVVATFRLDPVRQVFRLVSHYGVPLELQQRAEALEFPVDTVFHPQIANDQPVLINELDQAGELLASLRVQFGVTALLATPLQLRSRQLGAFVAARRSGRAFEQGELDLCNGIAQELAVAIHAVDLYRQQQDEAQVSGALAAVGQELISTLNTTSVLDQLCELTTRQLQCEFSSLVLLRAKEDAFVPTSAYGLAAEEWERLRAVTIQRSEVLDALRQVARDGLLHLERLQHTPWQSFNRQFGIASLACVALRRNREEIGLLVAGYRTRPQRFTGRQERILRGIAHLASMALENARLVEELQQANRVKSEFVATMSHELRTPLNIILGYSDLILEGAFGNLTKEQTDTIERIERSGRQLLELINATLDISRFEERRAPLDLREFAAADLMREVEADVREWLTNPQVRFTAAVAPDIPTLRTDPMKLKVLLKNLIGNAVKFTDHGSVSVTAVARDGGVEFTVSDTGVGIAPEVLPVIFDPFRQGDSSSTRRYGGVGLGLYIVRRIVDSLGGRIEVDSVVGTGTCFRVRLPRTSAAEGPAD